MGTILDGVYDIVQEAVVYIAQLPDDDRRHTLEFLESITTRKLEPEEVKAEVEEKAHWLARFVPKNAQDLGVYAAIILGTATVLLDDGNTNPTPQEINTQIEKVIEKAIEKHPPLPVIHKFPNAPNLRRNDPCPCGSGKKFKNCCKPKSTR